MPSGLTTRYGCRLRTIQASCVAGVPSNWGRNSRQMVCHTAGGRSQLRTQACQAWCQSSSCRPGSVAQSTGCHRLRARTMGVGRGCSLAQASACATSASQTARSTGGAACATGGTGVGNVARGVDEHPPSTNAHIRQTVAHRLCCTCQCGICNKKMNLSHIFIRFVAIKIVICWTIRRQI